MLTIEIRVNGNLVAVINAHNKGYTGTTLSECRYYWSGAEWPMTLDAAPRSSGGDVLHERTAGILPLTEKLCRAFAADDPSSEPGSKAGRKRRRNDSKARDRT